MWKNILFAARLFLAIICLGLGVIGLLIPVLPGWFFLFIAVLLAFPGREKEIIKRGRDAWHAFREDFKKRREDSQQDIRKPSSNKDQDSQSQ